jgi:hypothetical protein
MSVSCTGPLASNATPPTPPKRRGAPRKDHRPTLVGAEFLYLDVCNWLEKVEERQNYLPGWVSNDPVWRGSLSELAYEIVRAGIPQFRHMSWRRLQNLMSEMNREYRDFS